MRIKLLHYSAKVKGLYCKELKQDHMDLLVYFKTRVAYLQNNNFPFLFQFYNLYFLRYKIASS
jgi:hypothetical protein